MNLTKNPNLKKKKIFFRGGGGGGGGWEGVGRRGFQLKKRKHKKQHVFPNFLCSCST